MQELPDMSEKQQDISMKLKDLLEGLLEKYKFRESCAIYSYIYDDKGGTVLGIPSSINDYDFFDFQIQIITSLLKAGTFRGQTAEEALSVITQAIASSHDLPEKFKPNG